MLLFIISIFIFIPYTKNHHLIQEISDEEAENISFSQDVFVLGLDTNDHKSNMEKLQTIKNLALYYQDVRFSLFDPQSAQQISIELEIPLPAIFYYENGSLLASYTYPETENMVLHLCSKLVDRSTPSEAISTLNDLYATLNSSPFSILTPPDKYNQSFELQTQVGSDFGFVNIVNVTTDLLTELGLLKNDTTIGFYRFEDNIVSPANISKESLLQLSKPLYKIFMPQDLIEHQELVSFFADNLYLQEREFLYNISQAFPNLTIGYGHNLEDYVLSFIPGISGCELHQILVFNYQKKYYYDPTEYFGQFYDDVFDLEKWIVAMTRMLTDVNNQRLKPIYISEIIPPDENQTTVIQVVGHTYEDFVMDDSHDVIMLYRVESCPHCIAFFEIFEAFANECKEANLDFLKFGWIDIDYNASPLPFPFMLGVPHVRIFPAHNKANNRSIIAGRDRDALIRLIFDNTNHQLPFVYPPPDFNLIHNELYQYLMASNQINPEDNDRLNYEIEILSNYSAKPPIQQSVLNTQNYEDDQKDQL